MKKQQSGFTLIELMIVVAIIGILAAIAVPQYQNFMARSQAAESVVLLDGARTAIEDVVVSTGVVPTSATTLGLTTQGAYGSITSIVNVGGADGGTVIYTIKASGVNKNIQGKLVNLHREGGTGTWSCSSDLASKFTPKGC